MLPKIVLFCAVVGLISCQILPPSGIRRVRPGPTIHTRDGPVQGQEETYDIFRRIYTFKGIRYAQPPVGNLRFRQAIPPTSWSEVHQAFDYGPRCPQIGLFLGRFAGDEDCLFLNIATPTNIRSSLPVAVLIHGGGLQIGNGQMDVLGPELMNQENIVWVSMNYRLGVLGFLNTADSNSPGNFGLKDMILALRWVQNNIEFFGGNPNDVTIIGHSGGAVAVNALMVSPVAFGLFHKAVAQSGSLFSPWAFNQDPYRNAQQLGENLQLHFTSTADLVNQLRQVSVERLVAAAAPLDRNNPPMFEELMFMPSIDPVDSLEPRIIIAPIATLIRNGMVHRIPYIIGFTSAESLHTAPQVQEDPTILERFNQNPNLLIPTEWNLTPGSPQANEVINGFRNLYFGGAVNITTDMALQWADYSSDRDYNFGISKLARLHRVHQPVYYYRFSYEGSLNFFKTFAGVSDYPGAVHGDDSFYMYRMNVAITPVAPGDQAFLVQRRMVRMWTNFFKYGNPTVTLFDPLTPELWRALTVNEEFMDIDLPLRADVHPFRARMDLWHGFDQRFNP